MFVARPYPKAPSLPPSLRTGTVHDTNQGMDPSTSVETVHMPLGSRSVGAIQLPSFDLVRGPCQEALVRRDPIFTRDALRSIIRVREKCRAEPDVRHQIATSTVDGKEISYEVESLADCPG